MTLGMGRLLDSSVVYGGPDDTAPLLGELCTNQKSTVKYTSSGENMYLRFISDSSFVGKGFRASYKTVDSHCGGKMMSPFGQIHSSNYPDNYGHNDDCMWYIEVDQNHVVKLSFIDFDIEAGYNCSYDYLREASIQWRSNSGVVWRGGGWGVDRTVYNWSRCVVIGM
ncbi:unnamed protein product [Timema podura]|uniref:CUB domain-containing protein n=1 Tax=Timema podura TaxID=61482 RepID=A0ABN7P752_TIMPD|nr:unnamed protein product [Timema podura]